MAKPTGQAKALGVLAILMFVAWNYLNGWWRPSVRQSPAVIPSTASPPRAVASATPAEPAPVRRSSLIRAEEYGDSWPFQGPGGSVSCIEGNAAIISIGSTRYALNGPAMNPAVMHAWNLRDVSEVHIVGRPIAPVIDRALEQCRR